MLEAARDTAYDIVKPRERQNVLQLSDDDQ